MLFYVIIFFSFFRLISYLFHAHKQRWIHKKVSFEDFNANFIHSIVVGLLEKVNRCLGEYGELACLYMYSSSDGNLDVSFISTESCIEMLLLPCIVVLQGNHTGVIITCRIMSVRLADFHHC